MDVTLKGAEQGVGIITIDCAGKEANVLSESVLMQLSGILDEIAKDRKYNVIVIQSGKKDFALGADINDIKSLSNAELAQQGAAKMQSVFQKIEDLKITSVCAVRGQCLGGGLELALCCTYRVASEEDSTKFGFPEIQIGLIPGAGGTQRAPRLIGIQQALDLILTGKRVGAAQALRMGLVDKVVHPALLLRESVNCHKSAPKKPPTSPVKKAMGWFLSRTRPGQNVVKNQTLKMIQKNTKGFYPAPEKALTSVLYGLNKKLEKGLRKESELFGKLTETPQSKSLIHIFEATTKIKKHPKISSDLKVSFEDAYVGVIGAGFMGAGIATVCAEKDIKVRLSDPSTKSLGTALTTAKKFLDDKVKKKRLKKFEARKKLYAISPYTSMRGFKTCDIAIEAVFENLDLKHKILKDFEQISKPDSIFATNTSAIPISEIAKAAKHPERVIGMHFFSPVEKMPLLEIIATEKNTTEVVTRCAKLGQKMGKQVIIVQDGPGFYTTRALAFYLAEAMLLIGEGAKISALDDAMTELGFPVGPAALLDEVGIDVGIHVLETIVKAFPQRISMPPAIHKLQEQGVLGRKTKKGLYVYGEGKSKEENREIYQLLQKEKRDVPKSEIQDRCLNIFLSESVRCLEEKILNSPYDGDVGAVFGLGFPPFLGGPFHFMQAQGIEKTCADLEKLVASFGSRFALPDLLANMRKANGAFFEK
ncbi:MAG: 3-hydroxyacyl-CoA dehydrogenase NAD-binding domain-containing protein [Oligoflexales bacterium]